MVCLSVTGGSATCTSRHPSVEKAPLEGGTELCEKICKGSAVPPSLSAVETAGGPQPGQGQPTVEPGICLCFPRALQCLQAHSLS